MKLEFERLFVQKGGWLGRKNKLDAGPAMYDRRPEADWGETLARELLKFEVRDFNKLIKQQEDVVIECIAGADVAFIIIMIVIFIPDLSRMFSAGLFAAFLSFLSLLIGTQLAQTICVEDLEDIYRARNRIEIKPVTRVIYSLLQEIYLLQKKIDEKLEPAERLAIYADTMGVFAGFAQEMLLRESSEITIGNINYDLSSMIPCNDGAVSEGLAAYTQKFGQKSDGIAEKIIGDDEKIPQSTVDGIIPLAAAGVLAKNVEEDSTPKNDFPQALTGARFEQRKTEADSQDQVLDIFEEEIVDEAVELVGRTR